MKSLFAAILLAAFSVTTFAKTESYQDGDLINLYDHGNYHADLNVMFGRDYLYGHVSLNTVSNQVTLELQEPWRCAEGSVCILALPDPLVFTFTDLQWDRNWCGGTRIISDQSDAVFIGGGSHKLTLVDSVDSMCAIMMGFPDTMAMYHTRTLNEDNGNFDNTMNAFMGAALTQE